jgi:hypothetical protein
MAGGAKPVFAPVSFFHGTAWRLASMRGAFGFFILRVISDDFIKVPIGLGGDGRHHFSRPSRGGGYSGVFEKI